MQTPAVVFSRVDKTFARTRALTNVDLTIGQGEVVALLGNNGAGKTTALSLMLGLRSPSAGTVRLLGRDPRDPLARTRIGALLQESGLPGTLRVREVIELFRTLYPAPLATSQALAIAELEGKAKAYVSTLSGGQRQRLYFALALIGDPDLLFLDEPSAALDVEARHALWRQVRHMVAAGKTLVLTTHHLEEADALATRIIIIHEGRIVDDGTPEQIKANVGGKRIRFRCAQVTTSTLEVLPGVTRVDTRGEVWSLYSSRPEQSLAELFSSGVTVSDLEVTVNSLEDAVLMRTHRAEERSAA